MSPGIFVSRRLRPCARFLIVSIAILIFCADRIASAMAKDAAGTAEVPVRVGVHEDLDACGSFAEVKGLDPSGDGFLAVRSGPGTGYAIRDRLREGATFYVCGESRDGRWVAVVYPREGQTQEQCALSSPEPGGVYRGPCAYGWVNVLAG